jgi:uncharacterized iron-regulated protein
MTFLSDATQENIDKEIAIQKLEYDIHAYETQIIGEKRKLAECKKSELTIKAKMRELEVMISDKKRELNSL